MASNYNRLKATHYCYLDGSSALFLNRWDQIIKRFYTYDVAHDYACKNIHLVDQKL